MSATVQGPSAVPTLTHSVSVGRCDVPLIEQTLGAFFDEVANRLPEHEALVSVHQGHRYSYRRCKQRPIGSQAPCWGWVCIRATGWAFGRTTIRSGC